ncbi:hypothetical protein [Plantactinospora sp. KBS50]|uniref:hypothetical protein n=1 Tax=Plantactinospora sp. KBS50 TaxID=2024580 RepID=UPI000BAAC732|nr:hypothetical protein [Plantactinospora sp. KBS50]ASW56402.1 hypothetical protein CIK06_22935 [Plantactinospora sp. KBS50]
MTDREPIRPVEDDPAFADAVDDDTTVPQLAERGPADPDTPTFTEPGAGSGDFPPTDDLLGDPYGAGSNNAADYRTGAEQPWEAEDLARAEGRDPTPENVSRAQRELDEDGPAAVERTVP